MADSVTNERSVELPTATKLDDLSIGEGAFDVDTPD